MHHRFDAQWVEWRYVIDTIVDGAFAIFVCSLTAALILFVVALASVLWKNRK